MVDSLTSKAPVPLAERQPEGIKPALTQPVRLLTGGPGTGKTTSLRARLRVLRLTKPPVISAAPTGRAAKRLAEATGREATPLQRLVPLRPGSQSLSDQPPPLQADRVMGEEGSRLEPRLMQTVLQAMATGTPLLVVGDADPVPRVGAGTVLADVINSGAGPVVRLEQRFRHRAGRQIALAEEHITHGGLPQGSDAHTEFFVWRQAAAEVAGKLVIELVAERIPAMCGVSPADLQGRAPMPRGHCGGGVESALTGGPPSTSPLQVGALSRRHLLPGGGEGAAMTHPVEEGGL